jgi:hypothetical protein
MSRAMKLQGRPRSIFLRLAVISFLLTAIGCSKYDAPNLCPMDRTPAQVTTRLSDGSCEYSHYAQIERRMHSWKAACTQ